MRDIVITAGLREARANSADGLSWLDRLPQLVATVCDRWQIEVSGAPYVGGMCGWVAPVRRADGTPAVLKVTWPHPEAATESAALRWWDGAGSVRLLAEDVTEWVMLLERCIPGTPLREAGLPVERGLEIGAGLLKGLWSKGTPKSDSNRFDMLQDICDTWADTTAGWFEQHREVLHLYGVDSGIVKTGIDLLRTLPRSATRSVVLHGDSNPGNLLAGDRAPFLWIDPKPMVGDPAFDPWPLVSQLGWPLAGPEPTRVMGERTKALADQLDVPAERITAWGLARDVEAGLWRISEGDHAEGAGWIRHSSVVVPLLG